MVDNGVPVRFTSFEHEEDDAQYLVSESDDGSFVTASQVN